MAEPFEPGEWVRIRGFNCGGPVRDADAVMITFFDVYLSDLVRVPRTVLVRCARSEIGMGVELSPIPHRYEVSALHEWNPNRRNFTVFLEARPGDRWVVTDGFTPTQLMRADGEWTWQAHANSDDDEWRAAHWHTFEVASELAARAARDAIVDLPDKVRYARCPNPDSLAPKGGGE